MLRLGPSISLTQQRLKAQAVIAPVSNFTGTPLSGTSPLSVVFTDTSINGPLTAWHWEKNDGSGWVDFEGHPTVQYPTESFAAGTWSVRMTVTNSNSSNTKTRTDYLVVYAGPYIGPLDIVGGAFVAYGQRALASDQRGEALYTIREDSGDTTQSFNSDIVTGDAPISSITTFLDGADGFVSIWNDQSGNSSNVIQTTAGQQPLFSFNVSDTRPGAFFNLLNTNLMHTDGNITCVSPGEHTIFCVLHQVGLESEFGTNSNVCGMNGEDITGNGPLWDAKAKDGGGTDKSTSYMTASGFDTGENNGNGFLATGSGSAPFDAPVIIEWAWGAYSSTPRINGVDVTGVTDNSYGTGIIDDVVYPFVLGCNDTSPGQPADCFNGYICEFIAYPSILSDSDRTAIRQNIATYYGITLS